MGNVSAAEAPQGVPSPPLMAPPPLKEPSKAVPKQTAGEPASKDVDQNPGLYEDLHKQTKGNNLFKELEETVTYLVYPNM